MKTFYDKEKESAEQAQNSNGKTVINKDGKIQSPEFLKKANYTTKKGTSKK